jgi:hypothetical protein
MGEDDKGQTRGGLSPVGSEFLRILDKWGNQFKRPVPGVVLDGIWEKAGLYERHPDIVGTKRKSEPLPLP